MTRLTQSPRWHVCSALLLVLATSCPAAGPSIAAISGFDNYTAAVERRLARQHQPPAAYIAGMGLGTPADARLRGGDLVIENLTPPAGSDVPGAMLHHWRGTVFAPGETAGDFERLMRDFNAYPQHYSPEVLRAQIVTQEGDRVEASVRVQQKHILTVVLDTAYDITFTRTDSHRGYSISRSTHIAEIDGAGTPAERALAPADAHGFLWRLNTYWTYEERGGGLYMQIETVSLTRSIPTGLGWVVLPFVESVPRESLEFTLLATCKALRK